MKILGVFEDPITGKHIVTVRHWFEQRRWINVRGDTWIDLDAKKQVNFTTVLNAKGDLTSAIWCYEREKKLPADAANRRGELALVVNHPLEEGER